MCKNAVLDVFEPANVKIKHQNHIQWLIKVISAHKNFTSGLNMSLPVSQKSLAVSFESLLLLFKYIWTEFGPFRCHWWVEISRILITKYMNLHKIRTYFHSYLSRFVLTPAYAVVRFIYAFFRLKLGTAFQNYSKSRFFGFICNKPVYIALLCVRVRSIVLFAWSPTTKYTVL